MEVCRCRPAYQAQAGPRRDRRTKTLPTLAEARAWKRDVDQAFARGDLTPGGKMRLRDIGTRWLAAAEDGTALTRGGAPYRPSTVAGYRQVLAEHVWPAIGEKRLDELTRGDVQAVIGSLLKRGFAPTTARNALVPLRALYRWASDHEWTTRNPTRAIAIAGVSMARRERFAAPAEAAALLDALDERDRALWATALYAGLRRGELLALRRCDIDLAEGVIQVRRSYDARHDRMGAPKSEAGSRDVPIAAVLEPVLRAHVRRALAFELVFARGTLAGATRGRHGPSDAPFSASAVLVRARAAWREAGLTPVGLHEARHSFASMLLDAGAGMKVVSELLGHGSITVTIDLYAHLLPHARADAVKMLDSLTAAEPSPRDNRVLSLKRRQPDSRAD